MRKIIMTLAIVLLAPKLLQGQETVYLSNLGQASTGRNAVGSDSWLAAGFLTGNNVGGYVLNSIQLGMTDASGNPSGFRVMVYALGGGPTIALPGNSIGTLSGPTDPSTAGIYTYAPASQLTLSPSTYYFVVLTSGTTIANGVYEWSFMNTRSYNPSDSWSAAVTFGSNNGSSWMRLGSNPNFDFSEFALTATPIPEPSSSLLFLLASGIFIYVRRTFHR